MRKRKEIEFKVGLFVTVGTILGMIAVLMLGGASGLFTNYIEYKVRFESVQGMIPGAKVVLGGVNVGSVGSIDLDPKQKDVVLRLNVEKKYGELIREDSKAEIATQGMLGDRYLSIRAGSNQAAPLKPGSEIPSEEESGLASVVAKSDDLVKNLTALTGRLDQMLKTMQKEKLVEKMGNQVDKMELAEATQQLNQILRKINQGSGTLGALVNDPALYDDIKGLVGGANRNRIVRNLVRKTIRESEAAAADEAEKSKQQAGKSK